MTPQRGRRGLCPKCSEQVSQQVTLEVILEKRALHQREWERYSSREEVLKRADWHDAEARRMRVLADSRSD